MVESGLGQKKKTIIKNKMPECKYKPAKIIKYYKKDYFTLLSRIRALFPLLSLR